MNRIGLRLAGFGLLLAMLSLSFAPAEEPKKKNKIEGPGVAEIYEAKDGFRFRIKGPDDKSLAIAPKGFKTKEECEKALETIKEILNTTKVVEGKAK